MFYLAATVTLVLIFGLTICVLDEVCEREF